MVIDFSDYSKNKGTITPLRNIVSAAGDKKTALYLAVIGLSFVLTIFLFRAVIFSSNLTVEETLPPGVPFEAPPLDRLP